jgi:pimeloyl-ACP methyl ester carboxylesterase
VPVAPDPWRDLLAQVGDAVDAAFASDGPDGAARAFIESVGGPAAWTSMPERQRAAIGRAGTGALADAAMTGLTGEGLERVMAPVLILTGDASEPFYRPIADALAARIGSAATRAEVGGGLDHMAPGHSPAAVAAAVRRHLDLPTRDEETHP